MLSQKHYIETGVKPPLAKRVFYAHKYHGEDVPDYYHWLKKKEDPAVLDHIKAENVYTEAIMAETKSDQEKLYKEMLARIKETDLSVPDRIDDYYYYLRTEEGKQYPIHCRKPVDSELEQIILDENKLAEGREFFEIGSLSVSPDHKILAYSTDYSGAEVFTLRFKNLETGEELADTVENITYGVEWVNDNRTYFYTVLDEDKRPFEIYRRKLGEKTPSLVYHEDDHVFVPGISKTRSEKYLLIHCESYTTKEVWYLNADAPDGEAICFEKRRKNIEYSIDHRENNFYVVTNDEAINFKVMVAPIKPDSRNEWQEFVGANDNVLVSGLECFKDHLVLTGRENGVSFIRTYDLAEKKWITFDFAEEAYVVTASSNPEYDTDILRFIYSSLATPTIVFDQNIKTGKREVKKQEEVMGGYDKSEYWIEKVNVITSDGAKVPIQIFYKKSLFEKNGESKLLLMGYGSYGITYDPWFSSVNLSLVNRGIAVAYAFPRGGGELGRKWYHAGKFKNKKNTFNDFIACAEYLINNKYTNNDRLVIRGGSAGGLLIGAVTNLRPGLFKAVIAHVPFVDALNTTMDTSITLTTGEYEEWGNPNDRGFFDYIRSYSPYDNVTAKNYPIIFVSAGFNDPRVPYWEPVKWVAKLREFKTDDNVILLKTNLDVGHAGPSGRYDHLRQLAFEYAFILKALE